MNTNDDKTINFTKESLTKLPIPEGKNKRDVYKDQKSSGLQLRVTSSGIKTFSVYRRTKGGQPERVTLGRFPQVTVEQARKQAAKINSEIAEGANPAQMKRAHRNEMTFGELFKEYEIRHGSKKRSWRTDQSNFRTHLQTLSNKKISTITRPVISKLLSDMDKAGKAGATVNNVRALVSSIYSRAIEWGHIGENPVIGIKTRTKVKRDRFLQADELPKFFESVFQETNETMRDYILLALFTGARKTNLLEMRWTNVNIQKASWRIPRTKNGTPQNVTLSPDAITVLKLRRKNADNETIYVFPGSGKSGHLAEPTKAVIRVMQRAGIPYGQSVENGVTLHDLRRTLGSWQAMMGASLIVIGKSLNHKHQQTTAIYAHLDSDPVRQSVNTATAKMVEIGNAQDLAKIINSKMDEIIND